MKPHMPLSRKSRNFGVAPVPLSEAPPLSLPAIGLNPPKLFVMMNNTP